MNKDLLSIFEEYFYPQININGKDINADIERYETCYSLLHSLLSDLDEMGQQAGTLYPLPERWEDNLDEYFNECMTAYVMNSDNKTDLTDENADKYIPYEYTHCDLCGMRCYYEAYPQAIEDDGEYLCECCLEAIAEEGENAEREQYNGKKVKVIKRK